MATLTNTKIKDTYDGLLKTTDNEALDASGVTLIEDGAGNASALSVGRSGNGVTITGSLNATLATAAQPNITSLGTLSSLAVSGNLAVDTNTLYVDASSDSVSINDNVTANVPLTVTTNSGYEDVLYLKSSGTNIDSRISMFPTGTGNAVINAATNSLEFQTAGSEKMRIDSNGRVGIGTSSPATKVEIAEDDIVDGVTLRLNNLHNASDWGTGSKLGVIDFYSSDASAGAGVRGGIELVQSGGSSTYASQTEFSFKTFHIGDYSERMRITSLGTVLIAQTATDVPGVGNTTTGISLRNTNGSFFSRESGAALGVNRNSDGDLVIIHRSGTQVGSISVTSSATAYNTSSDYRLKENVVEMTGALDRVDALKPSRFNFIADPEKTVDGFLAHEVQAIVPEAVTGEKDEVDEEGNPIYQGIDQSKIVPLLVGAIKELRAEIELLKSQLNA